MANGDENNFFQIPHTGVDDSTAGVAVQTRDADMKMSNFGALNTGNRSSDDYKRTGVEFNDKDDSVDNGASRSTFNYAERDENPYVAGSTVKKTRDDQATRLGMYKDNDVDVAAPKHDVSDTNVINASGMSSGYNYPTEGWRSFGGKYDFAVAYSGGI